MDEDNNNKRYQFYLRGVLTFIVQREQYINKPLLIIIQLFYSCL